MPETYTFELTFTGLCVFTLSGDDRRKPDRVDVLLLNSSHALKEHEHVPHLSFDGVNVKYASPPGFKVAPTPDGRLLGFKEMTGMKVRKPLKITFRDFAPCKKLHAAWRPDTMSRLPEHPDLNDRSEEEWLDWVMALKRMNPETSDPMADPPFNGLKERIGNDKDERVSMVASVTLDHGFLKARGFPMQWNVEEAKWEYVCWTFKKPDIGSDGDPSGTHAMAGSVVLSIPGIPVASAVVLSDGEDFQVVLAPRREADAGFQDRVQATVANLPPRDDGSGDDPVYLDHFKRFYDPVEFEGNPLDPVRLPHKPGHTITLVGTFCPPTSHTMGS